MNPFRSTTSDKDRLTALAERLILSMASAQVTLPAVRPESLWALAIAVGGWWLKGNAPGIEQELRPFLALPLLYGQLSSIRSMPDFAAAASNATDASQLAQGGRRFAEVVSELGMPKLRAALTSDIFDRLQAQILEKFPPPSGLAEAIATPSAAAPVASAGVAVPIRASVGVPVQPSEGKAAPPTKPAVSETTLAYLRELYEEDVVREIVQPPSRLGKS